MHVLPGRRGKERRRRAAETIFRGDGGSATSGVSSAAAGAMGAVGALWSFIANDSAAENAQMPSEGPPVPKISKSDIRVVLQCTLSGACSNQSYSMALGSLLYGNLFTMAQAWKVVSFTDPIT